MKESAQKPTRVQKGVYELLELMKNKKVNRMPPKKHGNVPL